jgi:transcriptional regulator with GAF, ATPase, and Fis domain
MTYVDYDFTTAPASTELRTQDASVCLRLEIVHSPDPTAVGGTVPLRAEQALLLGRDVEGGLRIHDSKVSRLHLRIVWDGVQGGFRYADAGSANGTYVNGARVDSGLLLPNDVLRVGDTLLVCLERDVSAELQGRARALAGSRLPVLLRGPTGAGKEVLARAIHDASGRKGAFLALNCAALPAQLASSELFGHVRGAFSGAGEARAGLFRAADGGTLLLDEIGDLGLELQGQLLRVLQDGRVRPVGADKDLSVDTRIIAATHVDLDQACSAGKFREDLLHRVRQLVLDLPPLAARRWEILRLCQVFCPGLALSAGAAEALLIADWRGNVRELRAIIEACGSARPDDSPLQLSELSGRLPEAVSKVADRRPNAPSSIPPAAPGRLSAIDRRELVSELMRKHRGNITEVARELGKPRAQIYRWLRSFGILQERFR